MDKLLLSIKGICEQLLSRKLTSQYSDDYKPQADASVDFTEPAFSHRDSAQPRRASLGNPREAQFMFSALGILLLGNLVVVFLLAKLVGRLLAGSFGFFVFTVLALVWSCVIFPRIGGPWRPGLRVFSALVGVVIVSLALFGPNTLRIINAKNVETEVTRLISLDAPIYDSSLNRVARNSLPKDQDGDEYLAVLVTGNMKTDQNNVSFQEVIIEDHKDFNGKGAKKYYVFPSSLQEKYPVAAVAGNNKLEILNLRAEASRFGSLLINFETSRPHPSICYVEQNGKKQELRLGKREKHGYVFEHLEPGLAYYHVEVIDNVGNIIPSQTSSISIPSSTGTNQYAVPDSQLGPTVLAQQSLVLLNVREKTRHILYLEDTPDGGVREFEIWRHGAPVKISMRDGTLVSRITLRPHTMDNIDKLLKGDEIRVFPPPNGYRSIRLQIAEQGPD